MQRGLYSLLFGLLALYAMAQPPSANSSLAGLDSLMRSAASTRGAKAALGYAEKLANQIRLSVEQPDSSHAKMLNQVGQLHLEARKLEAAIGYFQQAVAIWVSQFPDHPAYAESLEGLGTAYFYLGDWSKVEPYWLQALALRERLLGKQHDHYASSLNNLGILYKNKGQYAKAERFYLRALEARQKSKGSEHPLYGGSLNNLGILYDQMGDYEKAKTFYLQAAEIQKKTLGAKNAQYAATLNNIGVLFKNQQDFEQAENYYLQAIAIIQEALGNRHPQYAQYLSNLGSLYHEMEAYPKAASFYRKALNLRKEVLGEQHPAYGSSVNNLGALYRDMGDYAKAESWFRRAVTIKEKASRGKSTEYVISLNNLADIYQLKGAKNQALEQLGRAIEANTGESLDSFPSTQALEQLQNANFLSLAEMNRSLSLTYQLLPSHQLDLRKSLCQDALQLLNQRKNTFSSEGDKLRVLRQRTDWILRSMRLLNLEQEAAEAFRLAEENRSVLLLDAVSNRRAYTFGLLPDSLIALEKELQREYAAVTGALAENRAAEERQQLRQQLTELNMRQDIFRNELQMHYPKYAALKYERERVSLSDLQAQLDSSSALLEYLVADSTVYLFYIDAKRIRLHEWAISREALRAAIQAFHRNLSDYGQLATNKSSAFSTYTQQAHWFYQKLLAPLLAEATSIQELIIIPDAELGHLPFESFLSRPAELGQDYRSLPYLLRDYRISYHHAATLWYTNKQAPARVNNGQLLAMAASYGKDSSAHRLPLYRQMRQHLQSLSAAQEEVQALEAQYRGHFAFDSSATERQFKARAKDYAFIHLAMHGLLNEQEPILSALVFSEDGDSLENNFLQAHEVSKMELHADLLVLSACETGFGRFERGNGIASLARAFMYAGVPALVVSLWQVNDASTSAIMQDFYGYLAKGLNKAEALRRAKLDYLTEASNPAAAHPAFWSPFILIGDSSPVELEERGSNKWLLSGLAAVLGLAFFFLFRAYLVNRLRDKLRGEEV